MSFIHYKLITNKNFEKITFDGVSLSVFDLKKIILEKKFRKQVAAPPSLNGMHIMSTGSMPNKKSSDVDLEITNADTNEGNYLFLFSLYSLILFVKYIVF